MVLGEKCIFKVSYLSDRLSHLNKLSYTDDTEPTEEKLKMPSCLVLHMDKFRGKAIRGIQSHTQRERKSNPNINVSGSKKIKIY